MTRLTRYIFFELLKVFVVALTALTGFVIVFFVVKEALNQGLGPREVLCLIPYALPVALQLTLPGTLLFTACMVYGRMSNANELVALKAMGISPTVPLAPIVVLATVLSLVAIWLNDVGVSWGGVGMQQVVKESIEPIAYGMLGTEQHYSSRGFTITVQHVRGRTLVRPIITYRENDGPPVQVTADEAELHADLTTNTLTISLVNMRVDLGSAFRYFDPEKQTLNFPLDAVSKAKRMEDRSPAQLSLGEIQPRLKGQRALIESLKESMAAEATYQMLSGDFAALSSNHWEQQRGQLAEATFQLHRLETEPWRRWANGFSCLCFVLVGAPMAIRLRNADVLTTFFLCFMPILVVYYPLLTFGTNSAKDGALPPIAVWLCNVVLILWGAWLLRRVFRY